MEKNNNRRNRSVLKSYFQKGAIPTEQQFAELIDSVSNIVEDGQVMRTPSGWAFFPGQAGHLDIGLYTEEPLTEVDIPAWTLAVTPEKKLTVRNAKGEAVMEALQDKSIVLYGSLKVEDEITATAYQTAGGGGITPSGEGYLTVPADKQWHDLPIDVSREGFGCRVYSVYASFREQGTGLCQLTRVTALWLNFMQQRIESPQKHWWGWTGSVRFRWQMREKNIYLQIRTKKQLPSGEIHCRVMEMYKDKLMEKGNNGHYIRQLAENENLYSYLQRQTLEEVHRLSGKVWTDFNAHDPGVTLVDIANYALTEMDYKLGFGTMDYLTGEDGIFKPERFGLFPPEKVYTTAPVTPEDYRRLFFARIPELENVWVECNAATGGYTVKIALPPFEEEDNGKTVVKQVTKIYNSHRNLCEYLDKVIIVRSAELEFHAEFEIEPGKDASIVLARLYGTILHYLSGGVYICAPEELETSGLSPEEWLEGAEGIVRVVIPMQKNTEYELYKKLCQVEGIRSFSTCYLMKDGKPQTDFSEGFSLKIPCMEKELKVRIRQGRSVMGVDMEKFTRYLKTFYYAQKRISTNESDVKGIGWGNMVGTYRNIFTYSPIAGEFPACYRLSLGQETYASFEAYLKLYDRTIQQGLEEVKELPNVLSIEEKDMGRHSSFRNIYALKSRYLDFLDHLYGVESQPEWLEESNCYGEMESETIGRRMSFLRHVAYLIKNRAKARDITMSEGEHNAPIVKEWFCRLLGINGNEEHTVGNVLPGHNLQLIEKKPDRPLADRLDALLIDERILEPEHVTAVTYEQLATDEEGKRKEYSQLRAELPIFNRNRISGDLFRHGISLGNYRIVEAKKGEYLLVVHNKEKGGWTNLGRTDNKKRLNTLANILRRYLLELNRECETVYVLEPVLVRKTEPFRLLIVLPMWTLRFHSPRFREMCRELLRSIIPAHLAGRIYWMDEISMQGFEHCYKLLMRALTNNDLADYSAQLLEVIYELLGKAVEIQILDDTN